VIDNTGLFPYDCTFIEDTGPANDFQVSKNERDDHFFVILRPTGVGRRAWSKDRHICLCLYILSVYNIHMKKIRVNVLLGKDQLAALKKKTDREGTNVSLVLRQLIDTYLKGEK
jgi:hypothetical protein